MYIKIEIVQKYISCHILLFKVSILLIKSISLKVIEKAKFLLYYKLIYILFNYL